MQEDLEVKSCLETLRKNNLFPIRKLGKGGFGSVYLVSRSSTKGGEGDLLAVKCTNKKNFARQPLLRKYLRQEIDVQGSIRHPHIVKLMRAFDDDGWNFMVMQYCEMGNLITIQSQEQTKTFKLTQAKKLMLQILDGLFHLHSKSIIHRDLKPENILLTRSTTSELIVKICDFGFAKQTEEQTSTFCGTTYFMAPQILAKRKYDSSVDVWAAGVIYFYMIFGMFPFKSLNMLGEIQSKCKDGFDLMSVKGIEQFSYLNQELKVLRQLFSQIFTLDPNRRIAIVEFRKMILQERHKIEDEQLMSTIETDSDDEKQILEHISQQIVFIQKVYQEIKNMKFLNQLEELALKYYLDKYCLTLLMTAKGSGANQTMAKMKKQLINNQNSQCAALQANLSKVGISKLPELFSGMKWTNFSDYKQEYRVVLSHCFSKASKTIQNSKVKSSIKLKLFCCHSINRVFDQQYIFCIFTHFFNSHRSTQYKLHDILKWIQRQTEDKINDTVRILCDRFYPKGK